MGGLGALAQDDRVRRPHALERVERRVGDEEKRDEAEQHPAPATRAARGAAHLGQSTTNTPAVTIATTPPSTRSFQTPLHGRPSQIHVGTTAAQ